jgi:hypothetical protein
MSKYAIANRATGQVVVEYGTFETLSAAKDFILYDRMMDYDSFMAGTGMLYMTEAAAGDFSQIDVKPLNSISNPDYDTEPMERWG